MNVTDFSNHGTFLTDCEAVKSKNALFPLMCFSQTGISTSRHKSYLVMFSEVRPIMQLWNSYA